MSDLSSTSDIIILQSDTNSNETTNSSLDHRNNGNYMSYDTMRFLFLAVAIITVLICLTICITVCICICLKRRREVKRHKNETKLLPEQAVKSSNRKSSQKANNNSTNANGKQGSLIPSTSSNTNNSAVKSFYYDNLDDIPFIDESRPTSVIDITKV